MDVVSVVPGGSGAHVAGADGLLSEADAALLRASRSECFRCGLSEYEFGMAHRAQAAVAAHWLGQGHGAAQLLQYAMADG